MYKQICQSNKEVHMFSNQWRIFSTIIFLFSLNFIFSSCGGKISPSSVGDGDGNPVDEEEFIERDDTGVTEEGKTQLVTANNQWALDLYSYLNSESSDKNIFFSPYSLFTVMAMAYEGARGQTADEIQSVFHFPEDHTMRRAAIAHFYNQLNRPKKEYQLLTANAVWLRMDLALSVFDELQRYYSAEVFVKTPVQQVNQWIEHKTKGKFKDVVQDRSAPGFDLINTIYFKGDWEKAFEESNTKQETFVISEQRTVQVSMMKMTGNFNYLETEAMQVLEMPYKGDELSMLIFLPRGFAKNPVEGADLASLEKELTEGNLNQWRQSLKRRSVEVHVPKFTFKGNYELAETLKPYMPSAFVGERADFSGFATYLFIDEIIHKSFVNVNEKGTEAAAVSVLAIKELSFTTSYPEAVLFRVDHPFVFLIQERKTGQILFMGKNVDPTKV